MRVESFGEDGNKRRAVRDAEDVGGIERVDGKVGTGEDLAEFDELGV